MLYALDSNKQTSGYKSDEMTDYPHCNNNN